jgi:murein DD-endopeptidase MepM/ murein hydrolase activator NlpD
MIRLARPGSVAVGLAVLLAAVLPVDPLPGTSPGIRGGDGQFSGKQGEILLIRVPAVLEQDSVLSVVGRFAGRSIPFFRDSAVAGGPDRPAVFIGLLGLDMQESPGTHELKVEVKSPGGAREFSYNVLVIRERYPVQRLHLPREMVDLDEEQLIRVKAEQEQVRAVLDSVWPEKLWTGGFVEPLQGQTSGAFGGIRIINGQPRSPHNGEDISAPLGTEVVATNDGIARLTVDHFFSGKGVVLDHGLGLYSMYFHLSEITVRDGETVTRGQRIGKVGASGRATGPHLHWAVRLNGSRVNPYSLLRLPLQISAVTP